MNIIRFLVLFSAALFGVRVASAQTTTVYKSTASATLNQITGDLKFGNGKTLALLAGSTFTNAATQNLSGATHYLTGSTTFIDSGATLTVNGTLAGTHAQPVGTGDSPTFAVVNSGFFHATAAGSASTGAGIEIGGGATPIVLFYNRTASAYLPSRFDALTHNLNIPGVGGFTLDALANGALFGNLTVSGTGASGFAGTIRPLLIATSAGTSQTAATTATTGVNLGFDSNSETGWVQVTREDVAHPRALQLNPLGGNVLVGTTSDGGGKLRVAGDAVVTGNFTASGAGTHTIGAGSATVILKGGDGGSGSTLVDFRDTSNVSMFSMGGTGIAVYNNTIEAATDGSTFSLRTNGGFYAAKKIVTNTDVIAGGIVSISTAGNTLQIKSGANAKAGTFTLTAGTVTVSNTSVTANSVIACTVKTSSGTLGTGTPEIVINPGVGFTATGVATDTSTYNFVIFEVN